MSLPINVQNQGDLTLGWNRRRGSEVKREETVRDEMGSWHLSAQLKLYGPQISENKPVIVRMWHAYSQNDHPRKKTMNGW